MAKPLFTDMARKGHMIKGEHVKEAVQKWAALPSPERSYRLLASYMNELAPMPPSTGWPHQRNADAILQKLRKAGWIEHVRGQWLITRKGTKGLRQ